MVHSLKSRYRRFISMCCLLFWHFIESPANQRAERCIHDAGHERQGLLPYDQVGGARHDRAQSRSRHQRQQVRLTALRCISLSLSLSLHTHTSYPLAASRGWRRIGTAACTAPPSVSRLSSLHGLQCRRTQARARSDERLSTQGARSYSYPRHKHTARYTHLRSGIRALGWLTRGTQVLPKPSSRSCVSMAT